MSIRLLVLFILLYAFNTFSAELVAFSALFARVLFTILVFGLSIEGISVLGRVCLSARKFRIAEALLNFSLEAERWYLFLPGKLTVQRYAIESECLQTALFEQQKYLRALEVNSNCLKRLAKKLGNSRTIEYLATLVTKGHLLGMTGQAELAETVVREVIQSTREVDNKSPGEIRVLCIALNNLGCHLMSQNKIEQACEVLDECLNLERQHIPDKDPQLAMCYGNIGYSFLRSKQYELAIRYCRQALEMSKQCVATPEDMTATFHNNLGESLRGNGNLDQAEIELLCSLAIREKILGATHPHRAYSYHNLARLRFDQGRLPESEEYFKKAIQIREKFPGTNCNDLQETIEVYCQLLDKLNRHSEAEGLRIAHNIDQNK